MDFQSHIRCPHNRGESAGKEGVAKSCYLLVETEMLERANSVFGLRLCEILLPLEEISLPATPSDPRSGIIFDYTVPRELPSCKTELPVVNLQKYLGVQSPSGTRTAFEVSLVGKVNPQAPRVRCEFDWFMIGELLMALTGDSYCARVLVKILKKKKDPQPGNISSSGTETWWKVTGYISLIGSRNAPGSQTTRLGGMGGRQIRYRRIS